ncbi:MAG: hypothetical protein Q7R35_17755 [Elusimicrobiota bacterium]|nr:hypothetical protein [Elusimicrobiota bacterium]
MNKSLIAALLLVCGGALFAQLPAEKNKVAAAKKTAVLLAAAPAAQPEQPAAQPRKAAKAEPARPAAAKPSEQDAEESVVMIDSKAETEESGYSGAYAAEQDDRAVPGGLPSSYGQCKGVINEAGRNILVFENPDDGAVSFVQVAVGKANVSWKLIDRIPRNPD